MRLARDKGIEVREGAMPREMLYIADELFMTGTAAEITPIRSVDRIQVGQGGRGPITEKIQKVFFEITKGEREAPGDWLTYINASASPDSNGYASGKLNATGTVEAPAELKVSV
jgi:branched-chain amino acid aminotransferase